VDYPRRIRGQKVALFFTGCNNTQPRWNSIWVSRKKLSKPLREKLLERVILLGFQRSPS
jgi:hypothetical protein